MYTCRSNACFNRDIDVSVFRRDIVVCHAIVDVFNAPCVHFVWFLRTQHALVNPYHCRRIMAESNYTLRRTKERKRDGDIDREYYIGLYGEMICVQRYNQREIDRQRQRQTETERARERARETDRERHGEILRGMEEDREAEMSM